MLSSTLATTVSLMPVMTKAHPRVRSVLIHLRAEKVARAVVVAGVAVVVVAEETGIATMEELPALAGKTLVPSHGRNLAANTSAPLEMSRDQRTERRRRNSPGLRQARHRSLRSRARSMARSSGS